MAEDAVIIQQAYRREAFRVLGLDPPLTTFISSGNPLRAS